MPGLKNFVNRHDFDGTNDHRVPPHPDRPPTVQKTRMPIEHNGRHVYDTDAESFDATQSSLDEQDNPASDDFQNGEECDQYYDRAGNGYHEAGGLDDMMSQMNKNMAQRSGYDNPDSYPPTTSGEPDYMDKSEDEVELDHPQAQSRAKQHRDFPITNDSQKNVASTPLVIQTHPPRTQPSKDEFKVTTKPTHFQKHVQHQKKLQSKPQVLSQLAPKHVPEPFQATAQATTMDQTAPIVPLQQPDQTHRQPARAQISTIDRRQTHVNEASSHPQQYVRETEPQEQHLNVAPPQQYGGSHQQQQGVEEDPEEYYGQDTPPEDLDYEIGKLYKKDFDDLQNDPFDGPLREDDRDAPIDDPPKSLEEKLMIFTNLDVQLQKELFSSLKIEQWEEAGDWFQGRFSEIFQKLKDARKKRRELASAFEKRIAQRQQALTKKRNITEEALSEMRKSGTQVLESTPRKKQRFTE
jgi:hypothetical protein